MKRSAQEANRRYFREAYLTGQHGWGVQESSSYAVNFMKELRRVVPGGRLLDVGCGEGRHSFAAARFGFGVTAIDYEPLALKRARRISGTEHAGRIIFRKADVLRLPFPDSSFDVVLDYGCLHHQRKADWPAYKASILRVLKSNGFYVLSVFSPGFHLLRESRRGWHIAYGAYRRRFTRADITGLFGREFEFLRLVEEKGREGGFWHVLMKRLPEASC